MKSNVVFASEIAMVVVLAIVIWSIPFWLMGYGWIPGFILSAVWLAFLCMTATLMGNWLHAMGEDDYDL